MNPLIAETALATAQNTASAMDALMTLLSEKDNSLYWLLLPIQGALDHLSAGA